MSSNKLGLAGITAIVFGSMIGSGIFNIAQNTAVRAGAVAVIIAWGLTAVGMLLLVYTFKMLNQRRPDLDAGIYQYAQEGFGNYAGFNIAWGYWICTACGNVAYAVMLNDSLGVFFPVLLKHGWYTIALDSVLVWCMYLLVINGLRSASMINNLITALKLICLALIIAVLIIFANADMFDANLRGFDADLGSIPVQTKNTMLITLWCFVGIEGAVVMASRAKRPSDVGKAGIIGFSLAWVIYVLVSVLCYGALTRAELAGLENPSIAYVLRDLCGDWAYHFVVIAVIIALSGGWVAWTLMCSQVPYEAALVGIMPKKLSRMNHNDIPACGLFISTIIMQIFIVVVVMAESVYMAAILITSMMVLPAYLFSGLFLWKASYYPQRLLRLPAGESAMKYRIVGILCTINCVWLLYAGGLELLLFTSLCYLPGTYFYLMARRENAPAEPPFTLAEKLALAALIVLAAGSLVTIFTGSAAF